MLFCREHLEKLYTKKGKLMNRKNLTLTAICGSLLMLLSVAYASEGKNIVNAPWDPGFEQGSRWWGRVVRSKKTVYAEKSAKANIPGVQIAAGEGLEGSGGLSINNAEMPQYFAFVTNRSYFPVKAKQRYIIEFSYNANIGTGSARAEIAFRENCKMVKGRLQSGKKRPEKEKIKTPWIKGSTGGQWQNVRIPFTVPDGVNGIGLSFVAYNFSGKISFDNLNIYPDDGKLYIPYIGNAADKLDEFSADFMKKAVKLNDFTHSKVGKLVEEPTEVYLGLSTDALHGAILLHHPGRKLSAGEKLPHDGNQVFLRDVIEFFITQVGGAESPYYQFAMDSVGSLYDGQGTSADWNSSIKTKVLNLKPGLTVIRFALPLKDLGFTEADRGLVKFQWKLNFCRTHRPAGKAKYSSTWAPIGHSFHEIGKFPMLLGDGKNHGQVLSGLFLKQIMQNKEPEDYFWRTDRKLYKELFSDKPNPNGIVSIWAQPLKSRNITNALQYGYKYSRKDVLDEYKKYKLNPHVWQSQPTADDRIDIVRDWCRETGLGAMVYFQYWGDSCAALYDDKVADKIFNSLEKYLEKNKGAVKGVHLGDECMSIYETAFLRRAVNPKAKDRKRPEFQRALKRIKEEFGYGKYGAPSSMTTDDEPFNYLAMRKFIISRMLEFQERLYKITRKYTQPNGKPLVCQTATAREQMHLLYPERFSKWCDVVALQSNPARLHRHVFMAKYMTDLSLGKPVSAVDHLEHLFGSFGPEKVAACMSQLARGGVTGLIRWGYDHIGGQRGKNNTLYCGNGHLPRWNTLNDISLKFKEMPLLKFPEPSYAVLLSQDTFLTKRSNTLTEDEAFMGLVGPGAGTWFKYISDSALLDGKARLEDWKAVVIVRGSVLEPRVVAMLEKYLANGGKVICFDPEIASFAPDGTATDASRNAIFGTESVPVKGTVYYRVVPDGKQLGIKTDKNGLTTYGISKYTFNPAKDTAVIARFEDGKAAATIKRYPNGGFAVLCALTPISSMSENSAWVNFAIGLFKKFGVPVKHDIWNFHFPFEPEKRPVFDSLCLTGNNSYWWRNQPVKTANAQLADAEYTLSVAPDHLQNQKTPLKFSFKNGNLTNRLDAYETGDIYSPRNKNLVKSGKLGIHKFADTWSKARAMKIDFRFGQRVKVQKVRLFYHGVLPAFTVKTAKGTVKSAEKFTDQVLCVELDVAKGETDFLEINFADPSGNGKLILSEIEIWGEK